MEADRRNGPNNKVSIVSAFCTIADFVLEPKQTPRSLKQTAMFIKPHKTEVLDNFNNKQDFASLAAELKVMRVALQVIKIKRACPLGRIIWHGAGDQENQRI